MTFADGHGATAAVAAQTLPMLGRDVQIRALTDANSNASTAPAGAGKRGELFNELRTCRNTRDWKRCLGALQPLASAKEYTIAIKAAGKLRKTEQALNLLEEMVARDVPPTTITLNAAISAAGKGAGNSWQKALQLLRDMPREYGLIPDLYSYNAAISACGHGGQWLKALQLLEEMPLQDPPLTPDVVTFSAVIAACGEGLQWQKALELLEEMEVCGVEPNVFSYASAVAALEKGLQWRKALGLLEVMRDRGVQPNLYCYNSAITACGNGGNWVRALELLREMEKHGVQPDVVSYCAAIAACEKSLKWVQALALLGEMDERGINCNQASFSAAIRACRKSGQWKNAIALLSQMEQRGVKPDAKTVTAVIGACEENEQWEQALQLYERKVDTNSTKAVGAVRLTAAISACEKATDDRRWEHALQLLSQMDKSGIGSDASTFGAAIAACVDEEGPAGWRKAIQLLDLMTERGIEPAVDTLVATMHALTSAGELEEGLRLLDRAHATLAVTDKPGLPLYDALLAACRDQGDEARARAVQSRMAERGLVATAAG